MGFWDLVPEHTNLKSEQGTLYILKTPAAEVLHLTTKLYWSRLSRRSVICDSVPRDRYFKLTNNLHSVNNLGDKFWEIIPLTDVVKKSLSPCLVVFTFLLMSK